MDITLNDELKLNMLHVNPYILEVKNSLVYIVLVQKGL